MLAPYCHSSKTASAPEWKTWLGKFIVHSERHEYRGEAYRKAVAELDSLRLQGRGEAKP